MSSTLQVRESRFPSALLPESGRGQAGRCTWELHGKLPGRRCSPGSDSGGFPNRGTSKQQELSEKQLAKKIRKEDRNKI